MNVLVFMILSILIFKDRYFEKNNLELLYGFKGKLLSDSKKINLDKLIADKKEESVAMTKGAELWKEIEKTNLEWNEQKLASKIPYLLDSCLK